MERGRIAKCITGFKSSGIRDVGRTIIERKDCLIDGTGYL
jgi:hypothetical protein